MSRRNPELPRSPDGIDGLSTPPGGLVAEAMIVPVMGSAQRHCESSLTLQWLHAQLWADDFVSPSFDAPGSRPRAFTTSRSESVQPRSFAISVSARFWLQPRRLPWQRRHYRCRPQHCNLGMRLEKGRIIDFGPIERVLSRPILNAAE
jgi:hypothetical protein